MASYSTTCVNTLHKEPTGQQETDLLTQNLEGLWKTITFTEMLQFLFQNLRPHPTLGINIFIADSGKNFLHFDVLAKAWQNDVNVNHGHHCMRTEYILRSS